LQHGSSLAEILLQIAEIVNVSVFGQRCHGRSLEKTLN